MKPEDVFFVGSFDLLNFLPRPSVPVIRTGIPHFKGFQLFQAFLFIGDPHNALEIRFRAFHGDTTPNGMSSNRTGILD